METLPRNFKLLASSSALALAVTVAPVDVQFRFPALWQATGTTVACDSAPPRAEAVTNDEAGATCQAAHRLGLEPGLVYQAPLLVTLSRAQAKSGGGSGGGGGGSGGGGSGGGGSGGGGSGGGGSGGGASAGGGSRSVSGPSSDTGASSSRSESGGDGHDGFGGVEQVGADLSASQEAEAIGAGWK